MLTTATRPYSEAELDAYSERMGSGATSFAMILILALTIGGLSALGAYAVRWLYAWLTSGSAAWTFPLIIGGAVAALIFVGLWLTSDKEDWTEHPPQLATDVTATADAAWEIENDSLDTLLVFRVEPDRYLLLTGYSLTPPIRDENAPTDSIASNIRAVLMGEGEYRVALDVSLTGPIIPLAQVSTMPTDDESPTPEGLSTTAELPERIRRAIGVE